MSPKLSESLGCMCVPLPPPSLSLVTRVVGVHMRPVGQGCICLGWDGLCARSCSAAQDTHSRTRLVHGGLAVGELCPQRPPPAPERVPSPPRKKGSDRLARVIDVVGPPGVGTGPGRRAKHGVCSGAHLVLLAASPWVWAQYGDTEHLGIQCVSSAPKGLHGGSPSRPHAGRGKRAQAATTRSASGCQWPPKFH